MDVGSVLEQRFHYFGVTALAGSTQGRASFLQETEENKTQYFCEYGLYGQYKKDFLITVLQYLNNV